MLTDDEAGRNVSKLGQKERYWEIHPVFVEWPSVQPEWIIKSFTVGRERLTVLKSSLPY